MKHRSILRIFSVVATLALIMLALPMASVLAAESIEADPEKGDPGTVVELYGSDYTVGLEYNVYFSSQDVAVGKEIAVDVTTWNRVVAGEPITTMGRIICEFPVPTQLTGGTDDEAVHGGWYFIYVTYNESSEILAKTEFLVTGFASLDIDEDEGIVGDVVEITGEGFMEDEDITVEYDGDDVTDDIDGDDETDGDGEFTFELEIPESTAGDHTIRVTDETGNYAEVTFTVEPNLELSAISGPPGTVLIVNGTGFGYRADLDYIEFDGDDIATTGDDDADRDGSFEFTFTVPTTLGTGTYVLSVEDDDGNEAEATFEIAIMSSIDKTTGAVGETLTITGTGFTAGTAIAVTYDGAAVTLNVSNIDSTGALTAQFSAPASAAGAHTIVLTVGTYTKTFTFTMEAVPPEAPNLLLPLTGEKAKQPITFDWSDVTDPSGVTYTLWISSDSGFTTTILLVEGLTESSYPMTEAQKLESVSSDAPYYWSVQAVDNAGNESAWAAAPTFTVGFTFNWPTWAWWVVGGIGAVVLILLFFWMGRRSITY